MKIKIKSNLINEKTLSCGLIAVGVYMFSSLFTKKQNGIVNNVKAVKNSVDKAKKSYKFSGEVIDSFVAHEIKKKYGKPEFIEGSVEKIN